MLIELEVPEESASFVQAHYVEDGHTVDMTVLDWIPHIAFTGGADSLADKYLSAILHILRCVQLHSTTDPVGIIVKHLNSRNIVRRYMKQWEKSGWMRRDGKRLHHVKHWKELALLVDNCSCYWTVQSYKRAT